MGSLLLGRHHQRMHTISECWLGQKDSCSQSVHGHFPLSSILIGGFFFLVVERSVYFLEIYYRRERRNTLGSGLSNLLCRSTTFDLYSATSPFLGKRYFRSLMWKQSS